jgi:hypothetical protein
MTTDPLDLSPYTVGKALPEGPVEVIARLLKLDPFSYEYSRARFNDPVRKEIVEYVIVRDRVSNVHKSHSVESLRNALLMEANNVP